MVNFTETCLFWPWRGGGGKVLDRPVQRILTWWPRKSPFGNSWARNGGSAPLSRKVFSHLIRVLGGKWEKCAHVVYSCF